MTDYQLSSSSYLTTPRAHSGGHLERAAGGSAIDRPRSPSLLRAQRRSWQMVAVGTAVMGSVFGCSTAQPLVTWKGDCPYEQGSPATHVVAIELSDSERDQALTSDRLNLIRSHASQAADCDAPFVAVILSDGRAMVILDTELGSELGTETARDLAVPEAAGTVVAEVQASLMEHLQQEPPEVSDPGVVYRFLDERLARLDTDDRIAVLVMSDGIAINTSVDLNRHLESDEIEELARDVAPLVDLEGRVDIDWHGLGATTDPQGPPGSWLDQLTAVWNLACEMRGAASCIITTT